MLQVNEIRENKEKFIQALSKRGFDASIIFSDVLQTDELRKTTQAKLDETLAQSNSFSKEIGLLYKNGEAQKATLLKEKTSQLKEESKELNETLNNTLEKLQKLLFTIPNVPNDLVPAGTDENDNEEICKEGEIPKLVEGALPHWELAKKYDLIDFELGVKITGAGFPVYKGKGARLQRALIAYFLDKNTAAGYTEYQLPLMVNEASALVPGNYLIKRGRCIMLQKIIYT